MFYIKQNNVIFQDEFSQTGVILLHSGSQILVYSNKDWYSFYSKKFEAEYSRPGYLLFFVIITIGIFIVVFLIFLLSFVKCSQCARSTL